ncbi:hypothetical protein [Glycomyces sp. NRRL B-16210]|uniref:hypothetical protein n=1 Tax=Glycomyces sp. NRRL B-16210 TaxID=1463821 RepID=UPI0004C28D33|nr:hypothetical protein [Glycomyces sp. NRRL B-16210]
MTSIDEASGAVGGNAEHARELAGGILASKEALDSVVAQTSALGLEAKTEQAQAASDRAEELAGHANTLAGALDALRAQVEALKGLLAGAAGKAAASASASGAVSPTVDAPASASLKPKGPAASTVPTRVGKRHLFDQVRLNSPAKEKNTVVLPHVDTGADVAAIKSGQAEHLRDNLYAVRGRVYGLETPSGTVYPVRGEGFVAMDKLQFTAFKGLTAYGGDRAAAERDPKIARFRRHMTDETWTYAQSVYEQGKGSA